MIQFRPFRNSDPPHLLSVWREQPVERGLMQPISNILLEMFVLSKPYFDRNGLTVAVDEQDNVVGFCHAGFGPDEQREDVCKRVGITCVLAARPTDRRDEVLAGLLERSEQYLRSQGAERLQVGGSYPLCPFYLGLCGGSDLPGVLSSDEEMGQFYQDRDYEVSQRCTVFDRDLYRFRVPVDRRLLQHRRSHRIVAQVNPVDIPWWDACVFGPSDQIRFQLFAKTESEPCGEVTYWDMGPLSTRPHQGGMGMINLSIREDCRRQALGTYLVADSMRQLQNSGVTRIETQVPSAAEPIMQLLKGLGFEQLREGVLFAK